MENRWQTSGMRCCCVPVSGDRPQCQVGRGRGVKLVVRYENMCGAGAPRLSGEFVCRPICRDVVAGVSYAVESHAARGHGTVKIGDASVNALCSTCIQYDVVVGGE